jgi:hypothetical protein
MSMLEKKRKGERPMIQVKVFDCEHEKDLEEEVNKFLKTLDDNRFVDIKFNVAAIPEEIDEQIYCFSAMILYKKAAKTS